MKYRMYTKQYLMEDLLSGVSPTLKNFITKSLRETAPWALSATIVPSNPSVGTVWSSEDNSQVRDETPDLFGTPTSPKNGVTLLIKKRADDDKIETKYFKVSKFEAQDFISQLNHDIQFPQIQSSGTTTIIPAKSIVEVRIEEDEPSLSQSKGKKTTDMGSRKAS